MNELLLCAVLCGDYLWRSAPLKHENSCIIPKIIGRIKLMEVIEGGGLSAS